MAWRLLLRAELRRGLRSHVAVVAMLAAVAATLTLAVTIGRVASSPWERTWQATGAPHLLVFGHDREHLAAAVATIPGVTASSGPLGAGFVGVHAGRYHVETRLSERPASGPGRAALVEGREGGLLLERTFARVLGVRPGDTVVFDGPSGRRPVRVTGLAVVSDQDPYPFAQPGLTFGSRALLDELVPDATLRFAHAAVRISEPAAAPAIADRLEGGPECPPAARTCAAHGGEQETGAESESWQAQRADIAERQLGSRVALQLLSALLILCAAPIVATLVSERILARARELAILRAGGLTPGGVVAQTALLYGALGIAGAALGALAGTLLAPLATARSEELLSAPGVVGPAPAAIAAIAVGTTALAALAAGLPAWLLARRPAAEALVQAAAGGRRRPSRLARAARRLRLPTAAVIGAGEAFARRPRALLAIVALALSVAAVVAVVAIEVDLATPQTEPGGRPLTTADSGGEPFDLLEGQETERLRGIVYPGVAVLLVLGLTNLVAALALGQRESRRDTGVLRAAGLTPRDTAAMVVTRQLTLALAAAAAGIPLGLALCWLGTAMSDGDDVPVPGPLALASVALGTLAACALVAAPLARAAARLPVTTVLRQD